MRWRIAGWAVTALLLASTGAAAAPPAKGWPCVQQFVPQLAAASVWTGPSLPDENAWQADPDVVALVGTIGPRAVPAEAGEAKIAAFVQAVPVDRRPTDVPAAFAGLLATTNQQRTEVIGRIRELSKRQHEMADLVASITEELRAAPGDDVARRDEIAQRRSYVIREFEEAQRTMRYACEVPVQLEARLGRYAHALESALPPN